jgi:hypothetical protein
MVRSNSWQKLMVLIFVYRAQIRCWGLNLRESRLRLMGIILQALVYTWWSELAMGRWRRQSFRIQLWQKLYYHQQTWSCSQMQSY